MKTNIGLAILHVDLSTNEIQCLMNDKDIIYLRLKNADILSHLYNIIETYIDTDPKWLNFNIVDISSNIESNAINIIYMVLVPIVIKNKIGEWRTMGEIEDEMVKKIIYKAIHKIAIGRSYFGGV